MKILVVQDFLRSGGTERQSILLANAFASQGHATTLLTFRPGGALRSTLAPSVTPGVLQPFDCRVDWFAPRLIATARRAGPDVILCMGRMANCYGGRLQIALPGTAVIGTMRTGKPLPAAFRKSLALVRHVVANSREAADTLTREHGVPAGRITVIYNSLVFPAEAATGRNDALRARHGASAATTVLLCVAMFRPEKNQRELIEIVDGLPRGFDWQLWFAGEGPERAECERLAAAKAVKDRVKFLGFHASPVALYRAADVAVHASWSEALSNFLIEAQAHGLPAIAYDAQGVKECFVPGRTGWAIAPDDRAAFRAALTRRMVDAPDDRRAIAMSARAFARETFEPRQQVTNYLRLFERLKA